MISRLFAWFLVGAAALASVAGGTQPDVFPTGELTKHTDCKKWDETASRAEAARVPGPSEACIQYSYTRGGGLELRHLNAGFNCCPGELTADVVIEEGTIRVIEGEAEHGCRCLCLYDLDIVVRGLQPAVYTVEVDEPYLGDGNEGFRFTLDLMADREGEICVGRAGGPWR